MNHNSSHESLNMFIKKAKGVGKMMQDRGKSCRERAMWQGCGMSRGCTRQGFNGAEECGTTIQTRNGVIGRIQNSVCGETRENQCGCTRETRETTCGEDRSNQCGCKRETGNTTCGEEREDRIGQCGCMRETGNTGCRNQNSRCGCMQGTRNTGCGNQNSGCDGNKESQNEVCERERMPVDKMGIGMGFVPWQKYKNVSCAGEGMTQGTIFDDLVKPFYGTGKTGRSEHGR